LCTCYFHNQSVGPIQGHVQLRRLPADRLYRRTRGRQPAADVGTERIAWKLVNMAEGDLVNTVGNEALVAVYNFLDGPNWSGVLSAVLNAEDEEENTIAVLRIIAGRGFCEPPVRVEGYGEFVVPHYPEKVFKEHFRLYRSTFQVCLQYLSERMMMDGRSLFTHAE